MIAWLFVLASQALVVAVSILYIRVPLGTDPKSSISLFYAWSRALTMLQEFIIRLNGFQKRGEKVEFISVGGVLAHTFFEAMLSLVIVMYYYRHGLIPLQHSMSQRYLTLMI